LVEEYDPATADSIVPPSWDKSDVAKWPWNEVWRSARNVLGSARILIVVGYSVPVTDQLSQALLRADIKRLNALIVVNPDSAARRRVLNVMSSGLDASARVVELSTISEFGSYLPRSPVEPADPDVRAELADLQRSLVAVARRVNEMHTAHGAFSSEQSDLKDLVEELDERLEKLSDELEDELQNVRGEIQDVDARVDSLRD